jgi:hypothetical protein
LLEVSGTHVAHIVTFIITFCPTISRTTRRVALASDPLGLAKPSGSILLNRGGGVHIELCAGGGDSTFT